MRAVALISRGPWFTKFRGSIELDAADLSKSKVSVEIEAASISTNEDKRDAHLRSSLLLVGTNVAHGGASGRRATVDD